MGRAEEFLDSYRLLEEELCKKYSIEDKTAGSPIVRYINDKEGREYKDRLNLCREIRNLLSHHSEFAGERILEPSNAMTEFLKSVTEHIKQPPLAVQYATLYNEILKTGSSQKAKTVMRRMQRQGFSHVPVIDNGEFTGIFSVGTVFSYALNMGMSDINDNMTIGDFAELLPPDKHETERFMFMPEDTTLFTVRSEFNKKIKKSKRLAAIFIMSNGSYDGRIVGMLTPWDVIG